MFINEDLPQIITQRRADIRAIYLNAKEKGHEAKMAGKKVTIDNITYQYKDLNALPQGLKLSDAKIVKVKGGLAFATANAYLSNFHRCDIRHNGKLFDSAERAYQFERCTRLGAPDLAQQVLDARGPADCKRISGYVLSTNEWDLQKREVMKEIVRGKFAQNDHLMHSLLLTGNKTLIEATTNMFWGAAAVIGSKLLKNGTWRGRNELGIILTEVREDLKREHHWIELRRQSSTDGQEMGSNTTPSPNRNDQSADDQPGTHASPELDLDRLSQSMQNVSVRRSGPPLPSNKKGKNKNRGRNKNRNINPSGVGTQSSASCVPMGNHLVTKGSTAHAQNLPGDVSNSFGQSTPQDWCPPLGSYAGFPSGLLPNLGIPPPGSHPPPPQGWPWQFSQAAFTPFSSQQVHPGMFFQQPWISNIPSNISHVPEKTGTSNQDMSKVNPPSTYPNSVAPLYSNVVANTAINASSNPSPKTHLYGFQKRRSATSGNKGVFTKHDSKEVRRKSMPVPPPSHSDAQNLSVRIGTQVIQGTDMFIWEFDMFLTEEL